MGETDDRLIHLATRHFNDLQGLHIVVRGSLVTSVSCAWLLTHSIEETVVAAAALLLAAIPIERCLANFYGAHFGRVRDAHASRSVAIVVAVALAAWPRPPFAQVFAVGIAVQSIHLLVDGWPYRLQELFVITAVSCIFWLSIHRDATAPGFVLVGLAWIITGVADHRLLQRAMRAAPRVPRAPDIADTPQRPTVADTSSQQDAFDANTL